MTFDDIIGQETVKRHLKEELERGRVPHALMLHGPEGCGALPLAIAYAQMLLGGGKMAEKLQHPDLHFAFPIYKKSSGKDSYCDEFMGDWREQVINRPYFGMAEWMSTLGLENQQLLIYANESEAIIRKLSLKASQGGYKVMVIWLPEKMHEACANKLLKMIEEPPAHTVFIMVSQQPDKVLQTIVSRTQMVNVPALQPEEVERALVDRWNILPNEAHRIARSCGGHRAQDLRTITRDADSQLFFDLFVQLMRLAYTRKVKEMKQWSEQVNDMGRERIKAFLEYCQKMTRENFIYNFGRQEELNYMSEQEAQFAIKFAPFINERNVIGIMNELSLAQRDILQNASPKIVLFDFALKMIVLIKNR